MEKKYSLKGLYNRVSGFVIPRNGAVLSLVMLFVLLLPVVYLSFVNRASGDDYSYGTYTRLAWMGTHSLAEVGKAVWRTIKQYYEGWQGTWFSIFVFSLQPEVFSDKAYVCVVFLMLFFWIGSTFCLFRQILCSKMKLDRWSFLLITVCFLIISIEFIPSTKSSIFWFNGCAHYMLPFTMCQVTAAWLLKYSETYRVRTLTGITFLMTLLGGANYQAALFALITACYVGIAGWLLTRNKRVLLLLIPVFTELAGLIVSMKAPGNKVRGGEEFGFSVRKGIETIADSFLSGIKDIGTYFQERPLIFVGLLMLFLLFILIFSRTDSTFHFQHSGWLAGMLFCLYSAMQAPAIYAGVEVSRGVLNTNFQVFLLAAAGILLIIAEKLTVKLRIKWKEHTEECVQRRIVVPGILLCLLLTVIFRSNIKTSTFYVCLDYIVSGQAADYKEQMDLQTRLLEDEQVEDVVLPFINDIQGPLMHMPVTVDPEAWTNTVVKEFYGKNSVVAMERPKWIELYGE